DPVRPPFGACGRSHDETETIVQQSCMRVCLCRWLAMGAIGALAACDSHSVFHAPAADAANGPPSRISTPEIAQDARVVAGRGRSTSSADSNVKEQAVPPEKVGPSTA